MYFTIYITLFVYKVTFHKYKSLNFGVLTLTTLIKWIFF